MTPQSLLGMTTPRPTSFAVVAYNPPRLLGEVHTCKNAESAYKTLVALSHRGWQRLWLRPAPVR